MSGPEDVKSKIQELQITSREGHDLPSQTRSAKWRHSFIVKQLEALEGPMDVVYRILCKQLMDGEYESNKVTVAVRRLITKQGELAAENQEKAFCKDKWSATWQYIGAGVSGLTSLGLGVGSSLGKIPADKFQAWTNVAQTAQTPFQALSTIEQQDAQSRQAKHQAEKAATDALGQQLDQEKSRSKEGVEGIRRGMKEREESNTSLFGQVAR